MPNNNQKYKKQEPNNKNKYLTWWSHLQDLIVLNNTRDLLLEYWNKNKLDKESNNWNKWKREEWEH